MVTIHLQRAQQYEIIIIGTGIDNNNCVKDHPCCFTPNHFVSWGRSVSSIAPMKQICICIQFPLIMRIKKNKYVFVEEIILLYTN